MLRRKAPRHSPLFSAGAAKLVADIEDLLLKIFVCLPIRSLVRFKSVSKRWLSIISDPSFCRRRSTSHPPTPSGIFLSRRYPNSPRFDFVDLRPNPPRVPFESLEFSVPNHGITILQSCNGLLLCCNENPRSDYYVYNPTTKEYRTLPKLETEEEDIAGVNLAFDPLRPSNYKVVCVRVLDSNKYQIEIYSSDSDSGLWKPCNNGQFSPPSNTSFDLGTYWNEAVHWVGHWNKWVGHWKKCLYLDMCEEKLHELLMPRPYDDDDDDDDSEGRRVEYFGNCGGHLHYIESSGWETVLHVFELKEDRSEWFEKYRVDLRTVVSNLFVVPKISVEREAWLELSRFTVLAIVDQSEEPYVVLQGSTKLAVRLNVNDGSFERLVYILNDSNAATETTASIPVGFGVIWTFLYIESLACV